ncbi:hypothetical protein GCM10022284_33210 [Streptomyces hundungensis]
MRAEKKRRREETHAGRRTGAAAEPVEATGSRLRRRQPPRHPDAYPEKRDAHVRMRITAAVGCGHDRGARAISARAPRSHGSRLTSDTSGRYHPSGGRRTR